MRIQHNIAAMNSLRQLTGNNNTVSKSLEKLSSGYRINRAGDDAAGLAISEKMRAQIRGLSMASKNAQDGISLVQTAEGALTETHSILQRMRELAVQASNGIYDNNDRSQTQAEIDALKEEVDRISTATTFNNIKILDGSQSAECAAAKENAARQEAANAELAEQNAAIAANNQAKLDAAQAEYDAAKAEYDAKTAKTVTNEDFKATATFKDGIPLSAAAAGSQASLTITLADVAATASQEETTLTFTNLATGNKFNAAATLEIDGVEINIAAGDTLISVMEQINQDATLGAKYTAQVDDTDLVLTNRTAGAAEDAEIVYSGGGTTTMAAPAVTQGKDEGVVAFKLGESVTIAGTKYVFTDAAGSHLKTGEVGVAIDTDDNGTVDVTAGADQLLALAKQVKATLGTTDYTYTNANGTTWDGTSALAGGGFTIEKNDPGEAPELTELQYTSVTEDGGVTVGTKGPLESTVVAGVNPSDALAAKNATVTYELNLGNKSEITNGSEVTIAGQTFKIFATNEDVVKAGATMNESIVLPNTQDEVKFTLGAAAAATKVMEIGGQEFTLVGNDDTEIAANLKSAFEQSDLADKYTLGINAGLTEFTFTAKDAATDVAALEVKYDGTAVTGANKAVTTGEEKLALAIQNKVSALTGIVNEVTVKDGKITFEAEYSDVTGEEFMAQMGQLGFNANVEAAPEKAEVELEEALVGEYEKVTAEDMDNGVTFQIGANGDADQRVKLQIGDMGAKALGIADVDLTTSDGANKAIDVIDAAIQNVSAQRAQLGAMQNRLEHTINNLDTNNENLSAAESRIRDVDMAAEMMAYTKNNVLVQAAQSMLAQANQQPQSVLSLLQ